MTHFEAKIYFSLIRVLKHKKKKNLQVEKIISTSEDVARYSARDPIIDIGEQWGTV